MIVQCATFSKSLNLRNIDKSVSDTRIRIRFPFESSFWISLSGCKLTILSDIQPANRIVIISDSRIQTRIQKFWNRSGVGAWKSDSGHLCSELHETSCVTTPLSQIGNWCELHCILSIFAKIIFMIVLAWNPKTMKFENPIRFVQNVLNPAGLESWNPDPVHLWLIG